MTRDELRNYVRRVPLVGGLTDCDGADHWEAFGQTVVVLLFSTAPIWLGSLIAYGSGEDLSYSALEAAMHSSVSKGELFMYCTALLAPIFRVALVDLGAARSARFASAPYTTFMGLLFMISTTFSALESTFHLNNSFAITVSSLLFAMAALVLYLWRLRPPNPIEKSHMEFKRQESLFARRLQEHRHEYVEGM